MKLFFNLIVILFCLNCFSQEDSIRFYNQNGKFEKAIEIAENLKDDYFKRKDTVSLNYINLLVTLGTLNSRCKRNEAAEKFYKISIKIAEKNHKSNEINLANCLNNLAVFYRNNEQYFDSSVFFEQVVFLREKNLKPEDTDYIYSLLNLAFVSYKLQNYTKAISLYLEAYKKQRKVFGNNHLEIANTLNNIAEIYHELGNFSQANENFLYSQGLYRSLLGDNSLEYLTVSNNLIINQQKLGLYEEASVLGLEILNKKSKIYSKNHPEILMSIITLVSIYLDLGKYAEAEKLNNDVFQVLDTQDSKNIMYSVLLNNIALTYKGQGKFKQAERFYLKNIDVIREIVGFNNKEYATALANLSSFYIDISNYEKALKFQLEALKIRKDLLGIYHNDYETSLDNLSRIYMYLGLIDMAEKYAVSSKELFETTFSKTHPQYAFLISNLANIYIAKENFSEAEKLLLEADLIIKQTFQDNHPARIVSLYNLGSVYFRQNKFNESKKNYEKCVEISNKKFDYNSVKMLAIIDELQSKPDSAANKHGLIFKTFRKNISESLSYLSADEFHSFIIKNVSEIFLQLSFLQRFQTKYIHVNIDCYENELLLKNLSLRNQQRIKNTIEKSDDNSLKEKYKKFIANKHYLTKLEEMPSSEFPVNYDQLKADTETLEKEITRLSSDFAESKKALSLDFKQIQQKLKPNEVIVDIVSFNYYNKKWTDSIMYGAFVIKKESKYPKYISLFEQKQLKSLLENKSNNSDSTRINKQYSSKAISDLFLKPLETELKNRKTIFIVPSGLAHQINFKALPINEKQTLGEQFNVILMGASSSIIDYKTTAFQNNKELEFILYGGIDYNKIGTETNGEVAENNFNELATRSGILTYNYLPGTNTEIEKINTEVQKHNFKSVLKTDKQATEESIKQLEGKLNPYVLHIATHGFFFEDLKQPAVKEGTIINDYTKQKTYSESDDPMMRSGLILAGANKYWGKTNEKLSTEDGILTAKEIANLDLSNCQLVVLSACETGLGQINGSEGVFGLQRAFKMAGVKNIIMSLWKVPDAQTSELFTIFYAECFKGQSIQMAFQTAQSQMKAKYAPYYWAGFVLLE